MVDHFKFKSTRTRTHTVDQEASPTSDSLQADYIALGYYLRPRLTHQRSAQHSDPWALCLLSKPTSMLRCPRKLRRCRSSAKGPGSECYWWSGGWILMTHAHYPCTYPAVRRQQGSRQSDKLFHSHRRRNSELRFSLVLSHL